MDNDAALWKLVVGYLVWLLASAAIALIAGLLVGAIATAFGVESQSANSQTLIAVVAVIGFALLAALPSLLKRRIGSKTDGVESHNE